MSENLLRNSRFRSEIKRFHRRHRDQVIDVILFGSVVRGKGRPRDVDLLIVFKEKESIDLSYELRKTLEKVGFKPEITTRTYKSLFASTFLPRESILAEGYSFALNRGISEAFGFRSFALFIYSLRGFSSSRRMLFHYALNGRGDRKGALAESRGIRLTNTAILVPVSKAFRFQDFLNYWKVGHRRLQILIPERAVAFREFRLR